MKKQIWIFIFMAFSALAHLQASLDVKLSHSTIGINESFSADFISKEKVHTQPDFTPLEENFDILSRSQNSSIRVINGVVGCEYKWHLVLLPKKEGQLTIPSITCGKERFPLKTILVTAARTLPQDQSIFLEVELTPNHAVYEQTQLIYKIKLYRSANIAQATLSEVKIDDEDAIIELLGKDIEYETTHSNGARYIVLERKYAIFPQHEGELHFSPIVFDGQIIKSGSFFNVQTEHKRIFSKPLEILVKPIPAPFQKKDWFAANNVKFIEEWSADPNSFRVNEPVTWTLKVTAEGCMGNQIPTVALSFPQHLKPYFDKPEISNHSNASGFIGVKQMKVALIATQAGEVTIPEVSLKWWDLKSDQMRTVSLPGRKILIQGGAIAMADTTPVEKTALPHEFQKMVEYENVLPYLPLWAWGLISLNLIWIIGLIKIAFQKTRKSFAKTRKPLSIKKIRKSLKQACRRNDAKKAEMDLLSWAAFVFPQDAPLNLMDLKSRVSPLLQNAVYELYESLYGQRENWQGDFLWKAVSKFKPEKSSLNLEKSHLRQLYLGDFV